MIPVGLKAATGILETEILLTFGSVVALIAIWFAWRSVPGAAAADAFPWDGTGTISSIWFWGLESDNTLSAPCDDPTPTFDILFYEDSGFATPGELISEHLDLPAVQRNPVGTYMREGGEAFQGWQYKVALPDVALPDVTIAPPSRVTTLKPARIFFSSLLSILHLLSLDLNLRRRRR